MALKSSNIPDVKLGIVAVSRDCFPIELSERRRAAVAAAVAELGVDAVEVTKTVESEADVEPALAEAVAAGANALVVFLGNFGPETPETLLVQKFDGPAMCVAAAAGAGARESSPAAARQTARSRSAAVGRCPRSSSFIEPPLCKK